MNDKIALLALPDLSAQLVRFRQAARRQGERRPGR